MPNIFYKVVSTTGNPDVYEPAIMCVMDNKRITYKIGETTKPPEGWGPLAAFPHLLDAEVFITGLGRGNHRILKGTGTPSQVRALWFKEAGKCCYEPLFPSQTVFLDSFTPTEEA